jgi:hypothetical protein
MIYSSAYWTLIILRNGSPRRQGWSLEFDPGAIENGFDLLRGLVKNSHLDYSYTNVMRIRYLLKTSERDWWMRVWVAQEILLVASAYLMLGEHILPWETAFQATKNYVNHAASCCRIWKAGNKSIANAVEFHRSMSDIFEVILSFQRFPLGTRNELIGNL